MFLSVCQLSVNENRGVVKPYTDWNANEYLRYAHLPVKPNNDYYTISDIIANGETINGDVISIMAVVKRVSADSPNNVLCRQRLRAFLLPPPRRLCFCRCLSVCLSVCLFVGGDAVLMRRQSC